MEKKPAFSFDNLETAFAHLSDEEMKKMQGLFQLLGYPILVKAGIWFTRMAFSVGLPIDKWVRETVFRQFCGGEHIADCRPTIQRLARFGVRSVLDYAVEGKKDEVGFSAAMDEIIRTIQEARTNENLPFAVFKVSGIADSMLLAQAQAGQHLSEEARQQLAKGKERFMAICQAAFQSKVRIMVDGEESWFQGVIDEWSREAMRRFNTQSAIIFNTFQLYRKDMLRNLKDAHLDAVTRGYFLGAKLVRGAYMEKEREAAAYRGYPDPIHKTKADTDEAFNKALQFCINNKQRVSVVNGSHNELSNTILAELTDLHGLSRNDERVYFSQLYGMSDPISFNLAQAGFNVIKYLPYGPVKEVLPYLGRRAKENSGISGQTGRELKLIKQEIRRRKNLPEFPTIA
ncbi:L-proline dehydrogenase [Cyclobacterium lianum]|uniref:L-proline dehydrogenase n=1 Tax=Cyclobacterium lianum TaxID=388280 RepID=A0A1M7PL89_9BACT|nr:proline dehydrogenase family protein [Cyclobacterium lianum]SHN18048.1 L-proline dehydrogenase [Cyclobacterium lianum]